jgi:catechol 2,3-dioxygenase-like lactoylglutathione lyase family enzyme
MADIRYLVHDVDTALAFYTQLLDFEERERWGPMIFAIVARGDLNLWLSGPQTSAARPMPDGRQPEPGGWNRLVLTVSDIESVVQRLRDSGARFRNDVISGPGGRQVLAEDPSGNPIELFEPAT